MVRERWGDSGEFKNIDLFLKILCQLGPQFEHFSKDSKSVLVVREKNLEKADTFKRDNSNNF